MQINYFKHFYLSVNGKTASIGGKEKWNTVMAVEEAKKKDLKSFRYENPEE